MCSSALFKLLQLETLSYKMVVSNNISVPHPKVELKICTTFIITYLKYFKQIYITLQFIL